MSELMNVRDIEVIAAEINHIKDQTRIMVLNNSIEIGRRLVEAKSIISHGQWGNWLEEKVNYSARTAQNLMRIFEEYGSNQISLFGDSNSQAFANLSYSQAVALLAIPDIEERETFVVENKVEEMSTRELQQAIKEKEKAEKELEEALRIAEELKIKARQIEHDKASLESDVRVKDESLKVSKENIDKLQDTLEREREGAKAEVDKLRETIEAINQSLNAGGIVTEDEINSLEEKLEEAENKQREYENKIRELEEKLNEKPIDVEVVEKVPEEVKDELNSLKEKLSLADKTSKFKANFDMIVQNFNTLFVTLNEMPVELKPKYVNATKILIEKMNDRL